MKTCTKDNCCQGLRLCHDEDCRGDYPTTWWLTMWIICIVAFACIATFA